MGPVSADIEVTFTPFLHRHTIEPNWSVFNLCLGTLSQTQEHENGKEETQLSNPQALLKDNLLLQTG